MAKFITTTEISWQIEKIIGEAKTFVIIVSPYLKIHSRLEKLIEKQLANEILFFFIYREEDLKNSTRIWLGNILLRHKTRITLIHKSNVHAKCYLNEIAALITSMNMHEYSMVNNIEYGMFVCNSEDNQNYNLIQQNVFELCSDGSKDAYYRLRLSTLDV